MADRSRVGIEAELKFGKGKKVSSASRGLPFRILVVADFGGHQSRGEVRPLGEARPQRVDLDSFGAVLRKIAPRLSIAIGDQPPFTVAFEHLEDFHPDHLFGESEFFAPMRELRRQLKDGQAFERAAALLGQVNQTAPAAGPVGAAPADDGDLTRLLGRPAAASAAAAATAAGTVDSLIRQAVAPHVVGKADPRQAQLIAAVDGMTGELMRAVLHDPGFQRLEAFWRGVDRLVHGLELDENLQLFVLDASREELAADFAAAPNLANSAMYRILVEHGTAVPWSLLVHATPCTLRSEDATLLGQLGTLAQEVQAAVVAGLDLKAWIADFASLDEQRACAALRGSTAATSVAVATPGIKLRLPYGKATDPIESFPFAEQSSPPSPERYLWGSAGFALAELLAKSYSAAEGWNFEPGDQGTLDDLPLDFFEEEGEKEESPATQAWLTEAKADDILKDGFIPLVAMKGRGEVRVPRIQSIASPPAALAGRWR